VPWQRGAQLPSRSRLRALTVAAFATLVIVSIQSPAPTAAASPADRVIAVAVAQRGRPWAYGASGPRAFDCSGLVLYAFGRTHELHAIGNGRYRGGSAMLRWARAHHLTTAHPQPGDIAVWGSGSHVGIYIGNGRVVSTLVSGVRVTGVRALTTPFTTFIRTGLSGSPEVVATSVAWTASRPAVAAKHVPASRIVSRRVVVVAGARLRVAPRVDAAVVHALGRGTHVGVLQASRDRAGRTWYRVAVGHQVGWVAGWLTRPTR
jgi:cell wall-associated NlpC family hydrolase